MKDKKVVKRFIEEINDLMNSLPKCITNKIYIDPPEGWKYGFPKECPKEYKDKFVLEKWLIEHGYPANLIKYYKETDSFFCRYFEKEDVNKTLNTIFSKYQEILKKVTE